MTSVNCVSETLAAFGTLKENQRAPSPQVFFGPSRQAIIIASGGAALAAIIWVSNTDPSTIELLNLNVDAISAQVQSAIDAGAWLRDVWDQLTAQLDALIQELKAQLFTHDEKSVEKWVEVEARRAFNEFMDDVEDFAEGVATAAISMQAAVVADLKAKVLLQYRAAKNALQSLNAMERLIAAGVSGKPEQVKVEAKAFFRSLGNIFSQVVKDLEQIRKTEFRILRV